MLRTAKPVDFRPTGPERASNLTGKTASKMKNATQTDRRFLDTARSNARVARSRDVNMRCQSRFLFAFEPITKGNRFKLHPDSIHDRNHWPCFEYKGR